MTNQEREGLAKWAMQVILFPQGRIDQDRMKQAVDTFHAFGDLYLIWGDAKDASTRERIRDEMLNKLCQAAKTARRKMAKGNV